MSAHFQRVLQIMEILCDSKQKRGGSEITVKKPKARFKLLGGV